MAQPHEPCPACGATSGAARDADGWSCLICGAVMIAVTPAIERPRAERPLLAAAQRARGQRATWGVTAGVSLVLGLLAGAGATLLGVATDPGLAWGALLAAGVVLPFGFGGYGMLRVRRASREVRLLLDEAEVRVAEELARSLGAPLDPAELTRRLGVTPARAEELLTRAQVEAMLAQPEPGVRLRVADAPHPEDPSAPGEAADEPLRERR